MKSKYFKKIFILICFLACCFSFLYANDYKITSIISIDCGQYKRVRLVFNNFLVIENIKYYNDKTIEFPLYEAKNKVKYPQVIIVDPLLENYILKTIKTYKEEVYKFDINKVKFRTNEISLVKGKSKRKANIELVIDEKFLIVCGIMSSEKGLWISWPGFKEDGYYHKHFYILSKSLKERIENYILSKYKSY